MKKPTLGRKDRSSRRVDPKKTKIECCILPSGNSGEIHSLPRLGMIIGVNPANNKFPIEFIEKLDGSLSFHYLPIPVATIATKFGDLVMSIPGIHIPDKLHKKYGKKLIPWNDVKNAGKLISELTYHDPAFQSAVQFVPGGLASIIDPCGVFRESLDSFFDIPRTIEECVPETIQAVYETIDQTADCLAQAGRSLTNCKNGCRSGWRGTLCRAGCYGEYALDSAWCVAHGIVTLLVEAAKTVWNCVILRGVVEGPPQAGDIILLEADTALGHAIDFATCAYGYSHAGLVCGSNIIHAIDEGVVVEDLNILDNRDFSIVRLGLDVTQNENLCDCVRSQEGEDYDHLEAITFGTINDPGREICTMLIMHCLDAIGVDRDELGLDGFVSPNDIARTYDVPQGHLV